MTRQFGFGVIGCGSIAHIAHFPSITKTEGAQLVACCDVNEEQARKAHRQWEADHWFTDYKSYY